MITIDATCITKEICGYRFFSENLLKSLLPLLSSFEVDILLSDKCEESSIDIIKNANSKVNIIKTNIPVIGPKRIFLSNNINHKISSKCKLYHCLHTNPLVIRKNIKTIATIHDFSALVIPKYFSKFNFIKKQYLKFEYKYLLNKMSKIIAISSSTKEDAIKYNILKTEENISIIGEGIRVLEANHNKKSDELYILAMGNRPHKNIKAVLLSFSKLLKQPNINQKLRLIIVGSQTQETNSILNSFPYEISSRIEFKTNISDACLAKLYKNAFCFLFPSLYEGFGLPILEAMSYETPIITSNISSMPEVAGYACILIPPKDINAIAKALKTLLNDKRKRANMVTAGRIQVKKFNWDIVAKQYYNIYLDVLNNN